MKNHVQVENGSWVSAHDARESMPAIESNQPKSEWQFVSQMENVLGDGTDLDAQFFVESWTVGVPSAIENFSQRRAANQLETWVPVTSSFDSLEFLSFVDGDEMRSNAEAASVTLTDSYRSSGPAQFVEQVIQPPKNQMSFEWETAAADCDNTQETHEAITVESACRLLGVTPDSSKEQIKGMYRRLASRFHPDRQARKSESERRIATKRMATINAAYRLLRNSLFGNAT
jgi:hypothetical protein